MIHIRVDTILDMLNLKDLSKVKTGFKSIPFQIYFEMAVQASAKKWREIQNIVEEERF